MSFSKTKAWRESLESSTARLTRCRRQKMLMAEDLKEVRSAAKSLTDLLEAEKKAAAVESAG